MDVTGHSGPIFTSGVPAAVQGDAAREAIASLRGYAYQLYASALAWLSLGPEETLHLEVAEDYAVATRERLDAVQVKDTAGSSVLTLRAPDVTATIDAFVDLVARNPARQVRLRFLSTARVGTERASVDRPAGSAGLDYWRKAAAGADVAPLRTVLLALPLKQTTLAFIRDRGDDALREELLKRLHWDGSSDNLEGLKGQLELATSRLTQSAGLTTDENRRLAAQLVHAVLEKTLAPSGRMLTRFDLRAHLETATLIAVPRRQLEAVFQSATVGLARPAEPAFLSVPMGLPVPLARRAELVDQLVSRLRIDGVVALAGGTGAGKSLVARLAADRFGGDWRLLDLYDLTGGVVLGRVDAAIAATSLEVFDGVIIDDLNGHDDPKVQARVRLLMDALRERDRVAIITTYTQPGTRGREALGAQAESLLVVPRFSVRETADLVADAGGDPDRWARPVYLASGPGHPQLVQALISDFRKRGWPLGDLAKLERLDVSALAIADERDAVRRRLRAAASPDARVLLDRLSVVLGAFERDLALSLAALPPPITDIGAQLDELVGPWIDRLSDGAYRLSPVLGGLAEANLPPSEREAVNCHVAEMLVRRRNLDVEKLGVTFLHALAGRSESALQALGSAVLRTPQDRLPELAQWALPLRALSTDVVIYAENAELSLLLRISQMLLETEAETPIGGNDLWPTLKRELALVSDQSQRERLEFMAYAKLLLSRNLARRTTDWLAVLVRFDTLSRAPERVEGRRAFETRSGAEGGARDATGFMFMNLALGVPTVSRLEQLFDDLDRLESSLRATVLSELGKDGNAALLLSHPWLEQQDAGTLDAGAAADAYDRMSALAEGWGLRELALRAQLTRAVMFDEYCNDPTAADAVVAAAETRFGSDLTILRARAKLLFHRKDYQAVLSLSEGLVGRLQDDPIDRIFAIREAAISAGNLMRWPDAAHLFSLAADTAEATPSETLKALAAGLRADQAVSAQKAGDSAGAIRLLTVAIEMLAVVDPEATVKGAYAHRVVRHAVVWLNGELTGTEYKYEDEPFEISPGVCSNPSPNPMIRDHPLAAIEGAWYLLADADRAIGGATGLAVGLRDRLAGRVVRGLEFGARIGAIADVASTAEEGEIARRISDLLQVCAWIADFNRYRAESEGLPACDGPFPVASPEDLAGPKVRSALRESLMFVFLMQAMAGREASPVVNRIANRLAAAGYPEVDWAESAPDGSDSLERALTQCWRTILSGGSPTPAEVFMTALRTFSWCAASELYCKAAGTAGEAWLREAVRTVFVDQAFRLQAPREAARAFAEALANGLKGHRSMAGFLVAAEPYVGVRLSAEYREALRASMVEK